jgi:hypothetical protein
MAVLTFEGTVENGQIRLRDGVTLPEHATVYVVIPALEGGVRAHVRSPRLACPERASFFVKEVVEVPADAEL